MRGFTVVSSLIGAAIAQRIESSQLEGPFPKNFWDVYGPAEEFIKSNPIAPVIDNRALKPEGYNAVRAPENCVFPLDVVIVQDSTGSFADDYAEMRNVQLKLMTDALTAQHPGTRFGLVSFKDRPIRTLGETFDYCHRFDLPLQTGGFQPLFDAYGTLWSNGGQDPAENQFGAIIASLQSNTVGWQPNSLATKLIVVSTDSWPHFADDGLNNPDYQMGPNTGVLDADQAQQCRFQYYPSPGQVATAMKQSGAYGAFLVFDGNYANGLVKDSWLWFNTFLGQSPAFVEPLANDSSNFWQVLSTAIKQIETEECVATTVPPTLPPTTLPPTTVPTTVPTTLPPTTTTPAPTTTTPAPTTTTPAPTTTTPAPTTTTPAPTTTTPAPTTTTGPIVTPVGPTEVPSEPCVPGQPCPCPEVVIKLRHRPAQLHLDVSNEQPTD